MRPSLTAQLSHSLYPHKHQNCAPASHETMPHEYCPHGLGSCGPASHETILDETFLSEMTSNGILSYALHPQDHALHEACWSHLLASRASSSPESHARAKASYALPSHQIATRAIVPSKMPSPSTGNHHTMSHAPTYHTASSHASAYHATCSHANTPHDCSSNSTQAHATRCHL
jgi:hypothetical protein